MIWLIVSGWIFFGLIASGFAYAYFREEYWMDQREDLGFALFWGLLFGPFAFILSIFLSGFGKHGWWIWNK